jgi:phage-related protein
MNPVISPASIDERQVVFIGSVQADLDGLPGEVRQEAIGALSALQNGQRPPAGRYKDLTGNDKLAGIGEIRLSHDGDTYRIYNVVTYKEVLYVLEAGIKKSVRGGAIPQQDVKRLEARFKRAKEDYETNKAAYQAGYAERASRRKQHKDALEAKLRAASRKPKGA